MDQETGSLDAAIGDTFTLTFQETLTGSTVAPFLGAGLNNVGWLIDTSLDASIQGLPTSISIDPGSSSSSTVYGQPATFTAPGNE